MHTLYHTYSQFIYLKLDDCKIYAKNGNKVYKKNKIIFFSFNLKFFFNKKL